MPFIAETGGLNAMIADSTALPEQVVRDAVRSAFNSAGQRCSAARVLFVQEEAADRTIDMLVGAIQALDIGDPFDYATDIGPVIDEEAQDALDGHKIRMLREGRQLVDLLLPESCRAGSYVTPAAFEIDRLDVLEREVFGPILHVVRYQRGSLDKVVAAINATGYGLTLGLHSRIEARRRLRRRARARRQPLRQPQPDRRRGGRRSRSAARGYRAPGPRPAGPIRCSPTPPSACGRPTSRPPAATWNSSRRQRLPDVDAAGHIAVAGADRHAEGERLVYWARR